MPSNAPPNSVATGSPATWPTMSQSAASSGQYRPGVEIDRLERPDVPGDRQRILTDEQVLERLEPVHRVARSDADDALVGLDPDDRDRERRPRHGVPRRGERRVQRDAQALQPDRGDPHESGSIADVTGCGTVAHLHRAIRSDAHRRRIPAPMAVQPRHAAVVEFDHVTKRYDAPTARTGGKPTPGAVNDLSLTVPAGKICILVGPSGCGKTTSLKMVNRLIEPTSRPDPHRRRRRRDPRRSRSSAGASAT